jgi:hypothetical protein
MERTCSLCKKSYPETPYYFFRNKNSRCGYDASCKECRGHEFGATHAKMHCSKHNIEKRRVIRDHVRYICDLCDKERHQEYYVKNKSRAYATHKMWKIKNIEKMRIYYRKYNKKLFLTSLRHVINQRISAGIRQAIGDNKGGRKWESLVGYTLSDLRNRLNDTMPSGYTWDDLYRGKLHIDHIRPVSSFHYESYDDDDFKACWDINNLRLLPAVENLKKGKKII